MLAVRRGALGLLLLLGLSACSNPFHGRAEAEASAAAFHDLYNRGLFDQIWTDAHSKFKANGSQEKFVQSASALQRKLGKVTGTRNAGWKVAASAPWGTTISINQRTVFEKGVAVESFVFKLDDGKAILMSYNISSPALILN